MVWPSLRSPYLPYNVTLRHLGTLPGKEAGLRVTQRQGLKRDVGKGGWSKNKQGG